MLCPWHDWFPVGLLRKGWRGREKDLRSLTIGVCQGAARPPLAPVSVDVLAALHGYACRLPGPQTAGSTRLNAFAGRGSYTKDLVVSPLRCPEAAPLC